MPPSSLSPASCPPRAVLHSSCASLSFILCTRSRTHKTRNTLPFEPPRPAQTEPLTSSPADVWCGVGVAAQREATTEVVWVPCCDVSSRRCSFHVSAIGVSSSDERLWYFFPSSSLRMNVLASFRRVPNGRSPFGVWGHFLDPRISPCLLPRPSGRS